MRRALLTAAAALAALALGAVPAGARAVRAAVIPGSQYLALGDSVTFGYEESAVVPRPDYLHAASFLGYPEHLATALHLRLANAACPGETSASFVNPRALSNGCENRLGRGIGYRTVFPLHARYRGSQLQFAVHYLRTHHHVRLITLMIGANDLFACQESTADGCTSLDEQHNTVVAIQRNVRRILATIRAHYRGQIVVVGYYALSYASPKVASFSGLVNDAQDTAARPFGVQFADGFGALRAGAERFGLNTCTAGLLTQWMQNGTPVCGVHPSYAGQALLAQAVMRATRLAH